MAALPTAIDPAAPDQRQAIIEAALNLFADTGVHGTRGPSIAQFAGVGIDTLYRYFESRAVPRSVAVSRDTARDTWRAALSRPPAA